MTYRESIRTAQREYWLRVLASVNHNISEASRVSKVNRTDIYKHLKRLGIPLPGRHLGSWGD